MAVDVLVDVLGSIDRGVKVTEDINEAFDAILGPFGRWWLLYGMWPADRDGRAVFRQLKVLLSQDAEELASGLLGDPERADLSSRRTGGPSRPR